MFFDFVERITVSSALFSDFRILVKTANFMFRYGRAIPHGGHLVNTLLKTEEEKNAEIRSCDIEVELDERQ